MALCADMFQALFPCFMFPSLVSALEDHREIKVQPEQDVPLQCRGPRDASVTLLEWSRLDLKSEGYVFFYKNERSYENYQHLSFVGRVELRDPEMKDGDASVLLKNVTVNDTGRYECRMITTDHNQTRSEIKNLIDLKVSHSGHTAGNIWDEYYEVILGLSVAGGLLLLTVIICKIKKQTKKRKQESQTQSDLLRS